MLRRFFLSCCLLLICPLVGHAEPIKALVETLPAGTIDWTRGVVAATGSYLPDNPPKSNDSSPSRAYARAREQATRHLLQTLGQVRLDAVQNLARAMEAKPQVAAKVAEMAAAAPVVSEVRHTDGEVVLEVQMSLLGGLAQLMLPETVKQVESIKSLASGPATGTAPDETERRSMPEDPNVYTGLVVDARGIGARPAMVPLLVDESGKEVYGSVFVSREYAVQRGVCLYATEIPDPAQDPRVGPKPLVVKGLHTLTERNCDIVISNTDAAKLMDASANLSFLKRCRVIILIDA